MQKKQITYIILLVGLLGILSGFIGIDHDNYSQSPSQIIPYTAELPNSTISYTTQVERVVEKFEVSVDLSSIGYRNDVTKINMSITYSNATIETYDLSNTSYTWTFSKYFDYQAPLDTHSFELFIWDGTLLLEDSYNQPFEIINSPPKFAISLINTTLYRNSTMYFNITPSDAETPYNDLDWSWQIFFGVTSITPLYTSVNRPETTNLSQFFSSGVSDNRLGEYAIKGIISDSDGGVTTRYANFTLLNNAPIVSNYQVTFPDEENPTYLLREVEKILLEVNVSDVEKDPEDINLRVQIVDEKGNTYGKTSAMEETSLFWDFEGNITMSKEREIGEYTCYITAWETINTVEYRTNQSFTFTLGNNIPDAENISYTINEQTPSGIGIRIKEFEQIRFTINVTDVDIEGIEIVRLHLKYTNDGKEFIYPFVNNLDENYIEYNLSAKDLAYGEWLAWVSVVDGDGAEVESSLRYSFDILEEKFTKALPWVMFVVGAVVAFGVSMAVLGSRYITLRRNFDNLLSRSGDYKKTESKPKSTPSKSSKGSTEEKTESTTKSTDRKKNAITKKHQLFRKIKKK